MCACKDSLRARIFCSWVSFTVGPYTPHIFLLSVRACLSLGRRQGKYSSR